jgi:hypothetical protein
MTDTSSSPAPIIAFDYASWEAERAREAEKAIQYLEINKAQLFCVLGPAGVHYVTVTFDGGGDSGQIEDISAVADNAKLELPSTEIEHISHVWGQEEPTRTLMSVADAIEQLAYDLLSLTHCGWENNDGAYGEFVFDVRERSISLEHNERYVATEMYSHIW